MSAARHRARLDERPDDDDEAVSGILFSQKPSLLFILFMGTILLVFGFWLYEGYRGGQASHVWPQAEGTVIESSMEQDRSWGGPEAAYHAHVLYEYTVGGVRYTDNTIRFGIDVYSDNPQRIERVLKVYPVGKKLRVYYNPEQPQEATLKIGVSKQIYVGSVIGAAIGMFFFREIVRFIRYRGTHDR